MNVDKLIKLSLKRKLLTCVCVFFFNVLCIERFHSLGEFDEGKRSCRKRLDGHNRRRRKAQPEPFYWNFKNFMSSYKGMEKLHIIGR